MHVHIHIQSHGLTEEPVLEDVADIIIVAMVFPVLEDVSIPVVVIVIGLPGRSNNK